MARNKTRLDSDEQHSEKAVRKVTAAEGEAMRKYLARLEEKPSVRFTVASDGSHWRVRLDHPDERMGECLLADALGSTNRDFVSGIATQLIFASEPGAQVDLGKLNFKLAVIKQSEPKDQFETMLVAQMAEVHEAAMKLAQQLAYVRIPQFDSIERAFTKLTRTFVMQMDAFKRYRSGVGEKVTLQHVSVAEGGQAIVGNVTQLTREQRQKDVAPQPPTSSDTNVVPMPPADESNEHDALSMRRKPA
jgi:hypothetical protein